MQEYQQFVEKFKPKKTTDDCYTPPIIYDILLEWCKSKLDIEGRPIVRPFYPGGDYEHYDYPEDCVVIDNPPFSIYSKIINFYNNHNIDYVLFCPSLTGVIPNTTFIAVDGRVVYENGACVNTSFVSNMFGDLLAFTAPELKEAIDKAQDNKKKLNKYQWPENVVSVSDLQMITGNGEYYEIKKGEGVVVCNTCGLKSEFGKRFLVNDIKAREARKARKAREAIALELTDKSKEIVNQLNKNIL